MRTNGRNRPERNDRIGLVLFVLFSFLSVYFLSFFQDDKPQQKNLRSENLTEVVTKENGRERVEYVNAEGEVTIASDKHYAYKIRELDQEGHCIRERFFDEQGNPFVIPSGYQQIKRIWEDGVCTEVWYLDETDTPVLNTSGCAGSRRFYNENGQMMRELFFDTEKKNVGNIRGEYGLEYEYDEAGRRYKQISLGADKTPILNNRGYGIQIKTYHPDGTTDAEWYYDLEGNAVSLSEGQYGNRLVDGEWVKIDRSGNPVTVYKSIWETAPWIVIPIVWMIILVACFLPKKQRTGVFVLYILFIVYMTLWRKPAEQEPRWMLFWSYRYFFEDSTIRRETLHNIWLFVPFGAVLAMLRSDKRNLLVPFVCSAVIEGIQYLFRLGLFETDDIFGNTLGGIIGILIGGICLKRMGTKETKWH